MNPLCHFMQVLICPRSPVMNLSFDPRSQASKPGTGDLAPLECG
jgi:hypothetical protein